MSYHRALYAAQAADELDETTDVIAPTSPGVDAQLAEILARLETEKRARKLATMVTIAGAVFAALRLGVLALPKFVSRAAPGISAELEGRPVQNPRRARRRRRRARR